MPDNLDTIAELLRQLSRAQLIIVGGGLPRDWNERLDALIRTIVDAQKPVQH
jgi:hypothetical protein